MRKNQKGFSALEVLVVVVIVGLVGIVGWLVYDRQKSKSSEKITTAQIASQEATKNKEDEQPIYFDIKEMGVKFVLPDNLRGLYYILGNDNKTAYFSLDEFKGTNCAADKTPQVVLTRYTEADFEVDSIVLKDKARKMGDNYYITIGGQAACSEDEELQKKASQLRADITKILPTQLIAQ
jgi:prepilin-type N-terminal cleavage/methylation domain-containing protein